MFDDEYYIHVKRKWEKKFFKIPGVRGVGLGPKNVNGKAIGELAIQVFVENKRPIEDIDPGERIPAEVSHIPTDVCKWYEPVSTATPLSLGNCAIGNIISVTEVKEGTVVKKFEIESPAHGLTDDTWITIRGHKDDVQNSVSYKITKINDNRFSIGAIENSVPIEPFVNILSPGTAKWIKMTTFDTLCCCFTGDITHAEPGPPVTLTSPGHGLHTGDPVKIQDNTMLLPVVFKIDVVDKDRFKLPKDVDPGLISHGVAGWKWFKVSIALTGRIEKFDRTKPVVVHTTNHRLSTGDLVVLNVFENPFRLTNHLQKDKDAYRVTVLDNDRFSLQEKLDQNEGTPYTDIDATHFPPNSANEVDFVGTWIRQTDDLNRYSSLRGGIRVQVVPKSEKFMKKIINGRETWVPYVKPPMIDLHSTQSGAKPIEPPVETKVIMDTHVGTLGCIAIDLSTTPHKKVFLSNAHVIAAAPSHPEVHQPDFYDSSTDCSTHRVGNLIRYEFPKSTDPPNAITVDAAISGIKNKVASEATIVDIGPVKGTARIQPKDIVNNDFRVWKRGAMTKLTEGIVTSIDYSFTSAEDNLKWNNQILVEPIAGVFRGFMNILGDSGSVLVNKDNMIVGLLHKGDQNGSCIASHIDEVETKLNIRIWKEGEVVAGIEGEEEEHEELVIGPGIPRLLTDSVAELTAAGAGSFVAMVQSHYLEVYTLVKTNKQFSFIWFHNQGPELIKQLRLAITLRTKPIPAIIQQKSLFELVNNIFMAMKTYGSDKLRNTIETSESWLLQILKLSYTDMLEYFRQQQKATHTRKPVYSE